VKGAVDWLNHVKKSYFIPVSKLTRNIAELEALNNVSQIDFVFAIRGGGFQGL
jgi:hypothetical protein